MKLTVFNIAFDTIFSFLSAFMTFFIIFNYFTDKTPAIILSITLSLTFSIFAFKIILSSKTKKLKKQTLDFKAKEHIRQFMFFSDSELISFFKKVYLSLGIETHKRKNALIIPDENKAVFFYFGFEEPTKTDVIKAYNLITEKESAELFCPIFSKELKQFAERFDGRITIKGESDIYALLKKANVFPEIRFPLKKKSGIKEILSRIFCKSRSKSFFLFGTAFMFMSFFVKFKAYYVFFAGALLISGILCKLFGKENKA